MSRAWRVAIATASALVLACAAAAAFSPAIDSVRSALLALGVLVILAAAVQSTRLGAASATVTLASILLGAAIPLTGPLGAALVGCVAALDPLRRRPLLVRVFNVAMN